MCVRARSCRATPMAFALALGAAVFTAVALTSRSPPPMSSGKIAIASMVAFVVVYFGMQAR
jgi:hypothetical protein